MVVRSGDSGVPVPVAGAAQVARQAIMFARLATEGRPALLDGRPAVVSAAPGVPFSVMRFTVENGRIVEMYAISDPARLPGLDLVLLDH